MNSFSTPKALLLSMLILLCITSCKKTTETISDGIVSSGVNITLDVDGGSKVIVNPNDPAGYATVTFEKNDIIYIGNNGVYCGYLEHDGELQVFDVMGRMVSKQHINGVETWRAASVPTGVYIFRLNGKSQKIVIK